MDDLRTAIKMLKFESDYCLPAVIEEVYEKIELASGEVDDGVAKELSVILKSRMDATDDPHLAMACLRLILILQDFNELKDAIIGELHKTVTLIKRRNAYLYFLTKEITSRVGTSNSRSLLTVEDNLRDADLILNEQNISVPW